MRWLRNIDPKRFFAWCILVPFALAITVVLAGAFFGAAQSILSAYGVYTATRAWLLVAAVISAFSAAMWALIQVTE